MFVEVYRRTDITERKIKLTSSWHVCVNVAKQTFPTCWQTCWGVYGRSRVISKTQMENVWRLKDRLTINVNSQHSAISICNTVEGNTGVQATSLKLKMINTRGVTTKGFLVTVELIPVGIWIWKSGAVELDEAAKWYSFGDVYVDW